VKTILQVFLDARTGGPLVRSLAIADALQKEGWRSVVVMPCGGDFQKHLREKGFSVYECMLSGPRGLRHCAANVLWVLRFPANVVMLWRIIRRESIAVVHLHGLMSMQGAVAARLCGCKIVWHLSSSLFPRRLTRAVMRLVLAWSDRIVIISDGIRDHHFDEDCHDKRVELIQECVDTNVFRPDGALPEHVEQARRRLCIGPDDLVVGTVGNVNPVKDYETLVEAAYWVIREFPRVRFLVLGALLGTQREYTARLKHRIRQLGIGEAFRFVGTVNQAEIPIYLALMDVFVFTSKAEGGPRATLEAMAMAKPVVSTRVGDVSCQIVHGQSGYIVNVGDYRSIAEYVVSLLRDPSKRAVMGAKARERVEDRFGLSIAVEKHRCLYQSLLNCTQDEGQ